MLVSELFKRLSLGELSNLSIANDGNGTIKDASKPQIIMHTNTALRRLYSRFILQEKTLLLQTLEYKTDYHLHPIHAKTQEGPANTEACFIIDHADDPFLGDVIKVLDVQDSRGFDLKLNVAHDGMSLFTPTYDWLQVPYPICGQVISVNYQARHAEILDNDETQEIALPEVLEEALTAFIGSQIYSGMTSQEALTKSQELLAKYEMLAAKIESDDLISASRTSHYNKFDERGFA